MAPTNSPESDPMNQVVSVATSEVSGNSETDFVTENVDQPGTPNGPVGNVESGDESMIGHPAHENQEADLWTARYSFGNFASRFIWGFLFIFASLFCVYKGFGGIANIFKNESTGAGHWRILAIIFGTVSTLFWLWLSFRIFKARLSHHYHLTNRRLFVTSGIMRHSREMMELGHLKEVSIRQERTLDHLFKVGTVVVVSDVPGSPILYLLGINHPQTVVDQIYHNARQTPNA